MVQFAYMRMHYLGAEGILYIYLISEQITRALKVFPIFWAKFTNWNLRFL